MWEEVKEERKAGRKVVRGERRKEYKKNGKEE